MKPQFQVQLKIRKPVADVFDAVVNPGKINRYFVQSASGPMAEGAIVKWQFSDAPGVFDVVVRKVVKDSLLVFEWEASERGYNTTVEMVFKPIDAKNTMVQITEFGWRETPTGLQSSYDNCSGWMHMLVSMKGWLEYGVNLRDGGAH